MFEFCLYYLVYEVQVKVQKESDPAQCPCRVKKIVQENVTSFELKANFS